MRWTLLLAFVVGCASTPLPAPQPLPPSPPVLTPVPVEVQPVSELPAATPGPDPNDIAQIYHGCYIECRGQHPRVDRSIPLEACLDAKACEQTPIWEDRLN